MNVHLPIRCDLPPNVAENGMARFFSSMNLTRCRQLAGGEMTVAERNVVLKALAEEWDAFTREFRVAERGADNLASSAVLLSRPERMIAHSCAATSALAAPIPASAISKQVVNGVCSQTHGSV